MILLAIIGINSATDNNITIFSRGIENWLLNRIYTKAGKTKGTDNEVVIINPTTIGSFALTKLVTKGDPRPVDIPDNKNIESKTSFEGFGSKKVPVI
jgi:hypothetical protein